MEEKQRRESVERAIFVIASVTCLTTLAFSGNGAMGTVCYEPRLSPSAKILDWGKIWRGFGLCRSLFQCVADYRQRTTEENPVEEEEATRD